VRSTGHGDSNALDSYPQELRICGERPFEGSADSLRKSLEMRKFNRGLHHRERVYNILIGRGTPPSVRVSGGRQSAGD
jgi:hypothetical protein